MTGTKPMLDPAATCDAVVRLVEALTHEARVVALHEAAIFSPLLPDPRWSAVMDLRIAASRETDAAERDLVALIGEADHELCLALIRRLGAARRDADARAEQAYRELPERAAERTEAGR